MVGIPPNNPLKDLEMPYPRAEALGFRNQLPPRANALGFQKKISVGRHRRETPLVSPGGSANQEPPFSPPTGGSTGTARSLGRPRRIALRPRIWTSATTDPRLSRFARPRVRRRLGPNPRASGDSGRSLPRLGAVPTGPGHHFTATSWGVRKEPSITPHTPRAAATTIPTLSSLSPLMSHRQPASSIISWTSGEKKII